jgi:DNA-directed RNA polymerase subunit beta'
MQLVKHFIQTNVEPEWMVLCLLPVLPPELRPIVYRSGDKVVTSDINELYKRVIHRNNNLAYLLKRSELAPTDLVMCQENWYKKPWIHFLIVGPAGNRRGMVTIKYTNHFQM